MRRCLVALLALLASTSLVFGQQAKVLAPHRPIAPRLPDNPPKTGPLRSMVGGLWMIDANFKSTIYIKNSVEIAPVTVTPILYLSNGKKITLADVTLEPSGTATVSVNDGLNANGISPWATLNGYVEIQYKWPWDPLCVTVTSVDTVHSVIFTNGLRPLEPMNPSAKAMLAKGPATQVIEAMWWKQEPQVTGFVALSNTTGQVIKAQLQVSDAAGQSIGEHSVTVSPHGTKTVTLEEIQSASGTAGGLRVTYNGGMNDLLPNGGLQDQASGYSASVPFAAAHGLHPEESTQSYAELGLMSGAADPMMQFPAGTTFTPYSLLRNVGEQPAMVTPSIYWMEGGNARSSRLQTMKLQPYQTQSLDVPALLSFAGLQNFNGSFNLVFDVEGSVLMASGSVDQKNTYVFEVMPASVKESASKSVGYWSTKNGDDTMTTLWNPADEAQDLVFTLFFSGGHYDLPVHLGPRATRMFNISEIIQNQIPDKDGNLIPPTVHEGNAKVSGAHAENEGILVAVDAGIYNVRKATCAYTCINCNGTVSFVFLGAAPIPYHGNAQASLKATWNTGRQYDLTSVSTWTSSNTSKATVSKGLTYGVQPGDVYVNSEDVSEPWAGQNCGSPPAACPYDTGVGGSGGGPVQPFISGVSPSPLTIGGSGTLSISGVGFSQFYGTPTVQFDGSGISVTSPSVLNDGSIIATYSAGWSTSVGSQNLTVSFASGGEGAGATSNPFAVGVVAPACPTSTSIASTTQELLSRVYPNALTGMGATVGIQLAPAIVGGNWNGTQIKESLVKSSPYSCPTSPSNVWPNLCAGSSTFTVGTGGETSDGQILPGTTNVFYDEHVVENATTSILDYSGIQSCTAVCVQTYSCNGTTVGTRTITLQLSKGTISGTNVTNVSATIQ
jgi:hypothetical protein